MCFFQVWLVCFGSTDPSTAETLPDTLLCLKGNYDREENHPAPQHLGKVFLAPGLCTSMTLCFLLCCPYKESWGAPQEIWGLSQRAHGTRLVLKASWAQIPAELLLDLGLEGSLELSNPACSKKEELEICTLGSSWPEPVKFWASSRFSQYVL